MAIRCAKFHRSHPTKGREKCGKHLSPLKLRDKHKHRHTHPHSSLPREKGCSVAPAARSLGQVIARNPPNVPPNIAQMTVTMTSADDDDDDAVIFPIPKSDRHLEGDLMV